MKKLKKYPFKVFVDKGGVAVCQHKGAVDVLYAEELLKNLASALGSTECRKILLINADTEGIPDIAARKRLAEGLTEAMDAGILLRAAVFSTKPTSKTVFRFIFGKADKNGNRLRVFESEVEARKWLNEEKS